MDIFNSVGGAFRHDSRISWGKIESLPKESSYSSRWLIVYLDFVVRLSIFLPFRNAQSRDCRRVCALFKST
jgi:hypothetical protein